MAVGRFQVMALLQAARAHVLGMPIETAKSWGLNRAIFYAAAKRGFKEHRPPILQRAALPARKYTPAEMARVRKSFGVYRLGDEIAYKVEIGGKELFTMGDELQTPDKFDKQIAHRFGGAFDEAWEEATKICQGYDKGVLLSQRYFYETVYKPRRDELAKKWTGQAG
jgi:hypothetical protein